MKNRFYKILFALLSVILSGWQSMAQPSSAPEMSDVMRSNGKIYVVVGVLTIVLTGLIIYLFTLDRKLTRIEKRLK